MSKTKLSATALLIFTSLFLSFIYHKNKTIKVELTKYFKSSEGYGKQVVFIDQNKWISANSGVLYLWNNEKLMKTYNIPGYNDDPLIHNPSGNKVHAGPYSIDLTTEEIVQMTDIRYALVEGLESPPGNSSGTFDIKNMTWDKDGKSIFVYTRFFPSRGLPTTPYSGIKSRLLLMDPASGKLMKILWESQSQTENFQLAISDKFLIAAGGEGIFVFDKNSGKLVKQIEDSKYAVLSLAVNAANTLISVGRANGTLEVYKINEDWKSTEVSAHTSRILTLAFLSSLDILVSGSEDKKIKFWKIESGKLLMIKEETFDDPVEGVSFDHAGKKMAVSKKFKNEMIQLFNVKIQ